MPLHAGDPVPWFTSRTSTVKPFHFASLGGGYIVLSFLGSFSQESTQKFHQELLKNHDVFDDKKASFFYMNRNMEDEAQKQIEQSIPGIRIFWDENGNLHRGLMAADQETGGVIPHSLIVSPRLRVIESIPMNDPEQHAKDVSEAIRKQPAFAERSPANVQAPILVVPNVFEKDFCDHLINFYKEKGGKDSGFMRQEGDKTVGVYDYSHKRRSDCMIEDEELRTEIRKRIITRLVPEIKRAFQFDVTHMERYIIACYEGEHGGFFNAHRDNTTNATAHRKFACTLNLNADDYEGGNLLFPEYGNYEYRAPTGGVVIFSCSILHQATPVTKGERYVFLPFLYDEAGAKLRAATNNTIVAGVSPQAETTTNATVQTTETTT